ncbi:hypothetical protein DLJ98_04610 [Haemophilus influenzae]|nr:hypothetical protein DLJ98_04610 [Haemophilus influenzae]
MALGTVSTSKGFSSIAIGRESATNERYATALGTFAAANAESSLALGKLTVADKTDSVALGSYSKTNVDAGVFGYNPLGKTSPDDLLVGNTPEETEKLKEAYENFSNEEKDVKTVKDAEDAMRVEVEKRNDLLVKWNKNEADLVEVTNKLNTETDDDKKAELQQKKAEFEQIKTQLRTDYIAQTPDHEAKERALKEAQNQLQADRKLVGKKIGAWQSTAAAVSVGDADNGITRQITNVAAGREDTDAVNVAQLKALEKAQKEISGKINQNDQTMQQLDRNVQTNTQSIQSLDRNVQTNTQSIQSLDRNVQTNTQSIQSLNRNVQKIDKDLRAGIAGAMAIGGLYQASVAGTKTISASVGNFKGQNAVAVGYSRLSDKGAIGVKFNASLTSTGDAGVSAGIGYTW